MTEASAGGVSRAEVQRSIVQRSLQDESFRQRLLEDPRATMEQELGVRLPAEVQVQAVEETAETIYLVLPSTSPVGQGSELSEQELGAVAGGGDPTASEYTCNTVSCSGPTCHHEPSCG